MTKPRHLELQTHRGPLVGRLVLLLAAYAPVVAIVGLRGTPCALGWTALGIGTAGVLVWGLFLTWLRERQSRETSIADLEFIDAEVTGYIVSILLPIVAASSPSAGDWFAYSLCGALILVVAFQAELWSVNPVTYAFGMRAARARVDGELRIVLVSRDFDASHADGDVDEPPRAVISERLGVIILLDNVVNPEAVGN